MFKDWKSRLRFNRIKHIAIWGVLFLSALALSGCGTLETLIQEDGETSPLADWIGGTNEETSIPATSNLGDGKMISLYFPDTTGKALLKEERTLPKTLSLARETVNQWLTGPSVQGSVQNAVDPMTKLLDISIKDGMATVDLSREFTQIQGNVSQEVAVYGLVNTLTQFPTVQAVKIRVEGKDLSKLGNIDLTDLSYREGLIAPASSSSGKSTGTGATAPSSTSTPAPAPSSSGTNANSGKNSNQTNQPDSPSSINLFSGSGSST